MTCRAFYKAINNICFIQHEIKQFFTVKPTFSRYTKVYEINCRVTKIEIPDEERWEKLYEFHSCGKTSLVHDVSCCVTSVMGMHSIGLIHLTLTQV